MRRVWIARIYPKQRNTIIKGEHPLFNEYEITRKYKFEEVVDPNTRLPKYNVVEGLFKSKTRYYMIDFKNIQHTDCKKVVKSEKTIDKEIFDSIVLQLSDETRDELRNKMGDYFARNP